MGTVKQAPIKREKLHKDLKTKKVYYFEDTEKKINQISREVFKQKDEEIHYPIGYDGGPKYKNIRKFIYAGFGKKLPVGVLKSPKKGLGFTRLLKPFSDYVEERTKVSIIRIVKKGVPKLTKTELVLTEKILEVLHEKFKSNSDKQKNERQFLAEEQLSSLFPSKIKKGKRKYSPGSIYLAIDAWGKSLDDFSVSDIEAIKILFDQLALVPGILNTESLASTKVKVDNTYLQDVIEQFEKICTQKNVSVTLEKKWQKFLKNHSWVLSYLFAFPVLLHKDEAYVGGKDLDNRNGKLTDFLIKNDLTNNVAFIEIKTHQTELLKSGKPYRGADVYSMSADLSGAICQVLNQRDHFQKEFFSFHHKGNGLVETFNSKCIILMGSIKNLTKKQVSAFELLRSNSKDVEIVTFDEFLEKLKTIEKLKLQS